MSEVLTVRTSYRDVSELAEGLISRVDEEKLMLPAAQPISDGVMVQFSVRLADDTPGFEGVGRCVASYDNGEEMPEEDRYDIVLDSLQLDGRAQVVHERILLARETAARGEPVTGEVGLDDVEQIESSVDDSAGTWQEGRQGHDPSTAEVALDEFEQIDAPRVPTHSRPPSHRPGASAPPAYSDQDQFRLDRPSRHSSWAPEAQPREPSTRAPSGLFDFSQDGLPKPSSPPRPEGEGNRVSRAPRPEGEE